MATSTEKKTPTKKDQLNGMLKAKSGADVETLSKTLEWQPHSTRAALTGLRKAGHEIAATRSKPMDALRSHNVTFYANRVGWNIEIGRTGYGVWIKLF